MTEEILTFEAGKSEKNYKTFTGKLQTFLNKKQLCNLGGRKLIETGRGFQIEHSRMLATTSSLEDY